MSISTKESLERVSEMRRAEAATKAALSKEYEPVLEEFKKIWDEWTDGYKHRISISDNWRGTVINYLRAGLNLEDLVSKVDITMKSGVNYSWPYFCGCCKREIAIRAAMAEELLSEGTKCVPD